MRRAGLALLLAPSCAAAPSSPSPRPIAEAAPRTRPGGSTELPGSPPARDLRLTRAEFDARWVEDCTAVTSAADACRDETDLDLDGTSDTVFEVRAREGTDVGLAVAWGGRTDVSVLTRGVPVMMTDVYLDGIEESLGALDDLAGIEQWRIVPRKDDGFVGPVRGRMFRAVEPTGTGIWLTGSDAAEILYWDGDGFRELLLGF